MWFRNLAFVTGVRVRKLTECVSGALFSALAISGLSGLVVECVSAFDFSYQIFNSPANSSSLRQEARSVFFFSVQNPLTY